MPRMSSGSGNIDKDEFNKLYQNLEQIRKDLSLHKCKNLESYTAILSRYNQANSQNKEIRQFTAEHRDAKNKLNSLESKIAVLMTHHNLKFGIQPDYALLEGNIEPKPGIASESDLEKLQFDKEMTLRERKISQYTQLLKRLELKRDEFHTRYPEDSCDDVSKAYGAACQLVNILNGYAVSYKRQTIDLNQLKENSSRVIQSRRIGILGEHRGVKELLTNLLFAIGTLGIGYAFAALFTQSFTPIKCNTDTVDLLNETNKKLDEIGGLIQLTS
ncbi:hypothetical protein TUM19329_17920 [Legionella antarctica]|uniref:Effector protein B, substrate of the Dot/Icm secretion system n=1 Tax=Legionella antarctica TaxID=2708020 RepID=A0A6F8T4P1_9GAMM|nr:hypothetical protein [Legionella antarctica]BCA95431.1 hypothetical protein TUM19329_17920 [Legionella antarctica]